MKEENEIIRKPNEIKKEISLLKEEWEKSKQYHEWKLIQDDTWTDDMIGFFNIGKGRNILQHLYDGHQLQIRHEALGVANIKLGSGKNVIIVENINGTYFNRNNIMSFTIWNAGKWYKRYAY